MDGFVCGKFYCYCNLVGPMGTNWSILSTHMHACYESIHAELIFKGVAYASGKCCASIYNNFI